MTVLNQADAIYLGTNTVSAVYAGANKVWPAPSVTPWSLVAHASAPDVGGSAVTPPIDTTGATLLVTVMPVYGATAPTVDNFGNTWIAGLDLPGEPGINMSYCIGGTVGPGHTFDFSGAYGSGCVLAFSGPPPLFDQVTNNTVPAYSTSLTPGAITPTVSNALLVTGLSALTNVPFTIDSGFTVVDQEDFAGGVSMGVADAYLVVPTPAAINPTWSYTEASYPMLAAMLSFIPDLGAHDGTNRRIG